MALPWFEIFVASYSLWVIVACASLLLEKRSPTATLAWIFAFIALPVVSGLYYMVFGPRRLQRRRRKYGIVRGALQRAKSEAPEIKLSADAAGLAAVARRLEQGEPTFASSVKLLDDGDATLKEIEKAIEQAHHHLHFEYYIWEPDNVGTYVRDLLAVAARRKVEVRVLYDAVGSHNTGAKFWRPLVEAGGEVRPFNRLRVSVASLNFASFRTHRKIVVDETVGIVGTANLDNRSFRLNFEVAAAFYDAHTIERLAKRFEEDRAASHAFPAKRRPEMVTALFESIARLTSPVL